MINENIIYFLITRVTISVCDSSHKLDLAKWSWLEKKSNTNNFNY